MADVSTEQILRLVCEHTGQRVSLDLVQLDQYIAFARGAIALASRPAEVDDEGLPPLPPEAARAMKGAGAFYVKWQEAGKDLRGELLLFTAEQYRQGQRDAVAADRARREVVELSMAAPSHTHTTNSTTHRNTTKEQ